MVYTALFILFYMDYIYLKMFMMNEFANQVILLLSYSKALPYLTGMFLLFIRTIKDSARLLLL